MAGTYDAIIIGGGHNGLVTACYLAKAKWKVLVLERRYVVGGACVTGSVTQKANSPGMGLSSANAVVVKRIRSSVIFPAEPLRLASFSKKRLPVFRATFASVAGRSSQRKVAIRCVLSTP